MSIFQPTPSARRVTNRKHHLRVIQLISTHTLRKEGDALDGYVILNMTAFQPTPSARRVTLSSKGVKQ